MASTQPHASPGAGLPREETPSLIASDKVEGTPVYGADGDRIGRIENVMIDKRSGQIAYAVLTFGGFLGIGNEHCPLPWGMLKYDEQKGGYVVNLTREQRGSAPRHREDETRDRTSPHPREEVDRPYVPFAFI